MTPKDHPDRVPLQLALTQLECLAENLTERKREAELKTKVKLLDGLIAQSHKVCYDLRTVFFTMKPLQHFSTQLELVQKFMQIDENLCKIIQLHNC